MLRPASEERATYDVVGPDVYSAPTELDAFCRLEVWTLSTELRRLYGAGGTVPEAHLTPLAQQVEEQRRGHEIEEKEIEVGPALDRSEGSTRSETRKGTSSAPPRSPTGGTRSTCFSAGSR